MEVVRFIYRTKTDWWAFAVTLHRWNYMTPDYKGVQTRLLWSRMCKDAVIKNNLHLLNVYKVIIWRRMMKREHSLSRLGVLKGAGSPRAANGCQFERITTSRLVFLEWQMHYDNINGCLSALGRLCAFLTLFWLNTVQLHSFGRMETHPCCSQRKSITSLWSAARAQRMAGGIWSYLTCHPRASWCLRVSHPTQPA